MIDRFTPRVLTDAVNKIIPPKRMLLDSLFKRHVQSYEEVIDYEIKASSRGLMEFVQRGQEARVVGGMGVTIKTVRVPSLREKTAIPASIVTSLTSGQPFGNVTPMQRFQSEIARRQQNFVDRATRRKEWMAAMALQGGFTITQDNIELTVDFQFLSSHKPELTGQSAWGASATVDIPGQFEDYINLISADSGHSASIAYFGENAAKLFKANKAVRELLDTKNYNVGTLVDNPASSYLGSFKGIECYKHNERYTNSLGATTTMIPTNAVIITTPEAPFTLYHSAIMDLDAGLEPSEFFSKQWKENDPSGVWLLVETNPLCVPGDPDALVFVTVA